ncbi:MAG: Wzz/FepE/Etk N-terminal domain-containing protein, partial [Pseudomonadota bacterium]
MNDRSIIQTPEPEGRGTWLDPYLPENQVAHYQPRPKLIDVTAIRGILFRQRWLFAAVITLALIGGLVYTLMATPMYEARATVKVEPYAAYIVEGQDIDQGLASNQIFDFLGTQLAVIQSRNLASTVAADQNLGERYDLLGENVDEGRPPNMSDEAWLKSKEEMAASILMGSVVADMPDEGWIISISYRSDNPVLAAEM